MFYQKTSVMKVRLIALISFLAICVTTVAQIVNPVHWSSQTRMVDDKTGVVIMTATIDAGWHLYDTNLPDGGPVATTFEWEKVKGAKLIGKPVPDRKPHEEFDKTFDMNLRWWTGKVTFTQKFEATAEDYDIQGSVNFMACNDETCSAPTSESFSLRGKAPVKGSAAEAETANSTDAPQTDSIAEDTLLSDTVTANPADNDLWAPVTFLSNDGNNSSAEVGGSSSLWYIFWACFGGGLLALLTPCVWPIIPMTVSFFLKKSGSRTKAINNALTYGISIIVIYVTLGLIVTALFGPSQLNAIATSAVCNILFFLLLVVFAISFFGAFNIELPSSWSNRLDNAASRTTGLLSIFFMAFTLAIVSFSCTGPIIGTLLVEAANQGDRIGPAVGMLGFSIALAIPFTLFALFPSWLKKMPRSGGWLNTVKVVLGFIELALSLKFLSVADLAYGWHILDREVFLALWIAIFGLLGMYLLGMFHFKSDGDNPTVGIGVVRFFLGLISLAFTAYLVPGLWGAPLRATSAFVPPLYTQDFNLYGEELSQYDDYDAGMAAAARSGKPVFLDFSGYGCVNCRKMDGAVLDKEEVKKLIQEKFITIQLMVDDKKELPQVRYVEENGKQMKLKTVGDLWSYLQRHKFQSNSQPYYVVLDAQGRLKSGPFAYKEDVPAFIDFLNAGLN